MTPTRYLTDALETTNEHIEEYLAELETAERTGKSRAKVINRNFDMPSYDMHLRFYADRRLHQGAGLVRGRVKA